MLSGQLLLSMIEELKRNAALNNFAVMNHNITQQDTVNQSKAAELHAQLTSLREQLLAQQVCVWVHDICALSQGLSECTMTCIESHALHNGVCIESHVPVRRLRLTSMATILSECAKARWHICIAVQAITF